MSNNYKVISYRLERARKDAIEALEKDCVRLEFQLLTLETREIWLNTTTEGYIADQLELVIYRMFLIQKYLKLAELKRTEALESGYITALIDKEDEKRKIAVLAKNLIKLAKYRRDNCKDENCDTQLFLVEKAIERLGYKMTSEEKQD